MPKSQSAVVQLAGFVAKFTPEIAAQAHEVLEKMRQRLPGALELVYDNYNALAIGFGPTERVSDIIFSIALYPRWISLFFFHATGLPDPDGLLQGKGNQARHVVLDDAASLDRPAVRKLMKAALANAEIPLDKRQTHRIIIESISAKQRPRRPAKSAKR